MAWAGSLFDVHTGRDRQPQPAQVVRWLSSHCNPLQVQERQLSPFHPPHKRIISNPKFMMMQPKTISRLRPLNKIHDEGEQGRKKLDK
jgi:hypothetical protein